MLKKIGLIILSSFLLLGLPLVQPAPAAEKGAASKKVSILIPGNEKDNGFMAAAFRGYARIKAELPVEVDYLSNVSATSDEQVLTEAMRTMAQTKPDLIIGHGGQCNKPAQAVAAEFPDISFVVIQGNVKGSNLSSYMVNQEQSAWLAGALAGLTTKSNVVAHLSGAWPKPGINARAAFYHGLMYTNPDAKFLTWFTGNLDDQAINKKAAEGQIAAGADVIYTMLNGGRLGAIEAMKESRGKARGIGNVIDWVKVDPEVFIGSAVADSSVAIFNTVDDFVHGRWRADQISVIGLEQPEAVDLTLADSLPPEVKDRIVGLRVGIADGSVKIETVYNGPEFYAATGDLVNQEFKEALKADPMADPKNFKAD